MKIIEIAARLLETADLPCQHTVVTEIRGDLVGKRVVRGREIECLDYCMELPQD